MSTYTPLHVYFLALLSACHFLSLSSAVECTFSWSTVTQNNVRTVGQGTISGGVESCGSNVMTGTWPQLKGQSINQCGWPSGTITGTVTVSGAIGVSGTYNITNAEAGDYFCDVQCNLATGYPYAMTQQGINFAAQINAQQTENFKVIANQQYVTSGSDRYAPYANTIDGYTETAYNG